MASRGVGLCSVVSAMCDASQCTTIRKPLGVFTELRRCAVAPVPFVPLVTHLRAYNEAKRELQEGGRERRSGERTVEKVLSNAVVPPSVLRNTIISVTSLTVVSFEYPRVGRFDRIILRGIEPRSVISCSGAYVQTVRGEERYRTELFHDS